MTRLMFGGDVMLGRLVKSHILRFGPFYPLAPIAALMRAADLAVVNLECALASVTECWPGARKAFYFGAPPEAVESLRDAGVDMVSLANNHVLDYGVDGLRQSLGLLREHDIRFAGAGIRQCPVRPADADQTRLITQWITRESLEMGTHVRNGGGMLRIDCTVS